MELNQIDLLILNENGIVKKEIVKEEEGSLQTIEKPQERNICEFIKTEKEIEEEDSLKKAKNETLPRIPFGFFSLNQENRRKYIY